MEEAIPRRFCGPPNSANGGWTCGTLAGHVDAPTVEVTLRRPPPLEVPMAVDEGRLVQDGEVVAEGRAVAPLDVEPAVVSRAAAIEAVDGFLGWTEHAFPGCFTCGPDREPGDALRLLTGPVAGQPGVVAAPFDPPPDLTLPDGTVDSRVLWAALDCPGAWALGMGGQARVLGRLTAELRRPVPADAPLLVTGRADGEEGRKGFGVSAVLDDRGEVYAVARSVWLTLDPEAAAAFASKV
jgi:hypothetical protein